MNAARQRRFRREYREHLATWRPVEWGDDVLLAVKLRAEGRMARQDYAIAIGRGIYGRVTEVMLRAGPLRTDEWIPAPSMVGIGRRLGAMTRAELEVE